ncbi:hypothetical protein EYF80_046242 [Liparis tanakae]|uniref:Secreted protein n=1 Tax=Liparis tanakae TaxID=230148 RepID=A0A4Z2FQZ2_9TELE|nr:hypothetical protein EYF80_046242 [Liparis tanakae]
MVSWPFKVSLFVVELFVLRPVVLELAEELDELGLVLQQDVQDGLRLVGVGHKHLARDSYAVPPLGGGRDEEMEVEGFTETKH